MHGNNPLAHIFCPGSIAVIGASSRDDSVGRAVFSNILFNNYKGIVYPVNPKAKSVIGVKAYPSILDIPDDVDLAIIIVPSKVVPQTLNECGQKGVKGAVVISAGFKEVGGEGVKLEKEIIKISKKHKIPFIGPNCFGVINTDPEISLNATFSRIMPIPGNVAFVSQSGALGVAALEYAEAGKIGLSVFASLGNKAVINENDLMNFLKSESNTNLVLLYLEDLEDPKVFIELATSLTSEGSSKPILAIKSGRTSEGAKAASSHTGALAKSDEVFDSLFAQCGVIRVEALDELFDHAKAFSHQPVPKGKRVAIVTNAGGPGILATDATVRYGLELATFSKTTINNLKKSLPQAVTIQNPLDLIGDAQEDRYEAALTNVINDENVDAVLVICTPQMMTDLKAVAKKIVQMVKGSEKPVFACLMAIWEIDEPIKILEDNNIPYFRFPEIAVRALSKMAEYSWWIHRPKTPVRKFKEFDKTAIAKIINKAKKEGRNFLPEPEAHEILRLSGFPILPFSLAKNEKECLQTAKKIGYPVVTKIVSPDILHKVDVDGVRINIVSDNELKKKYSEMLNSVKSRLPNANVWGVMVQKMAEKGNEVILGLKRDPHFGPLLMFGLGGIYVEAFKDVTFRIAPIKDLGAHRMIQQIRSYKILEGFRGQKPSDIETIAECIERLSQLAIQIPEIEELDINPLIVYEEGKGAKVIDARILIS